jgi:hypothetical protein
MTDNLPDLLKSLYDIRTQKNALDKIEKSTLADIKPLVDPMFEKLPDAPVVENGIALTRITGTSRSIQADLLLERGVSPDVVAYSTKTTTYFSYRVKEQK